MYLIPVNFGGNLIVLASVILDFFDLLVALYRKGLGFNKEAVVEIL